MKLKEKWKQFSENLYDSSIPLMDRMFVVCGFCMLLLLLLTMLAGIILGESPESTLAVLILFIVCLIYVVLMVKLGRFRSGRIIAAVFLIFLYNPASFFFRGGIDSGAPVLLVLYAFLLLFLLDGKLRVALMLADVGVVGACLLVGYLHPEFITEYPAETAYLYTLIMFFLAGLVLSIMLGFQAALYKRESKIAAEKTKELAELNRSQNRFFSSMSHEIRTPINTVLGLNEVILRQEDASEEIKKDAMNIQGAGRLLLALINDILDVSKIEAGKMDIIPVNYSVAALLSEIVNMVWLKAEEKGLKFSVDIDPNVPETLFGDEVRIKQILINLLNNAVKYTREGSVSLHMESELKGDEQCLLKISVSDTGMGIKADALPHLFDTFQRQDEEKNRYIEGTGLGLSIVKQLVELMGGEITVNSVYTQGSTFLVVLKQGIASAKRVGEINIQGGRGSAESVRFEHSFHAPNARILIVDDNEMNLQVEKKLLDGTEIMVDLVMSGQDALAKTLHSHYDVIFMDHLMPEMDGLECFEKIRSQNGGLNRQTPVIVLTANAGGENIELYNNTGFDGYLVKPVSGRQLENMLIEQLPEDKLVLSGANEITGAAMNTAERYVKKRPVAIATSTMCDLPAYIPKELKIGIIPYTVTTNNGVFYDNVDIDAEELISYMGNEHRFATSDPPLEDELPRFFSEQLKTAHHLIYISLTSGSSREYGRVAAAAKTFDNVTVVNSELLSSALGILVLIAARLAQKNLPPDKIVAELEEAKKRINCSFVIRSTDIMARRGHIKPFVNNLLNTLWLRPVLRVKKGKLGADRMLFGDDRRCYEKYIQGELSAKRVHPDTGFVFITYAGMKEEDLVWIEESVKKKVPFKRVIFQQASAGITSNCGEGTFGLLFLEKSEKNYNLNAFFHEENNMEEGEELWAEEETLVPEEEEEEPLHEEPPAEKEWYDEIDGIDAAAAIQNSGSKEAFLSVLPIYCDSFEAKAGEIRELYEAKDWENYTIKVHALKSSSRLVGAVKLGEAAEALEMAGKRSDAGFITEHHESMMEEYRAVRDALAKGLDGGKELPDIPEYTLADAYEGLTAFSESEDYDLIREVLDSVDGYRLPPEDEERFEKIDLLLMQMDFEGIRETLIGRLGK